MSRDAPQAQPRGGEREGRRRRAQAPIGLEHRVRVGADTDSTPALERHHRAARRRSSRREGGLDERRDGDAVATHADGGLGRELDRHHLRLVGNVELKVDLCSLPVPSVTSTRCTTSTPASVVARTVTDSGGETPAPQRRAANRANRRRWGPGSTTGNRARSATRRGGHGTSSGRAGCSRRRRLTTGHARAVRFACRCFARCRHVSPSPRCRSRVSQCETDATWSCTP